MRQSLIKALMAAIARERAAMIGPIAHSPLRQTTRDLTD